ncbi:MAG TPA: HAD-IA family hydrolase [Bauldia sp.]|nr:HAD-IA family hydrolase [Bauldia sp.]
MKRTIVFDLDGTLVDTAGDLVDTLNAVLAGEGMAPMPFDAARASIGSGARAMLKAAFAAAGVAASEDRLDRLMALFLAHYADHLADKSRPYPGVPEALDRLVADGWGLAVCTNKLEKPARALLSALGLADRFAVIAGQDTFGVRKPDPRHLLRTIERASGRSDAAVMVGDSSIDAATAVAAGVPMVFATFGYGPRPETEPERTIGHFDELAAAVAGLAAFP